uniref:Cytochrome P450 n=1 Tax=Biomphalaria glabrata TaxID=6526 RepID=A0A2C9K756_BIOGL
MFTLIIVGSTIALSVAALYKYMTANQGVFKKLGIDHPPTSWFFGNAGLAFQHGNFDLQKLMYKQYKDHKVYGWYDMRRPVMVIKDLDIAKDIFIKNFNNFVDRYQIFDADPPFKDNLLSLSGNHWKHVRGAISPVFSASKIKKMSGHIERNSKILLENLRQCQETGQEVELKDICSNFALDVIASTGFGLEINTQRDPKNKFAIEAKKVMNPNAAIITLIYFFPVVKTLLTALGIPVLSQRSLEYFAELIDQVIEDRKKEERMGTVNDFVDLVMRAEAESEQPGVKKLTRSEIHGQALAFILAGFETVSTVLSFTLFYLAMNPECCQKAQEEVDDKCGEQFPDYDEVQSLTYIDMCINESMRLAPPGFFNTRICVEDTVIHGIQIPKDMVVGVPVYAIHHDPEIYPEPEKFDPERFNSENKASRHPMAHLPFGHGPRSCIGMRLALLELKMVLVTILQQLTPVPCSKSVFPIQLSKMQLKATNGLWVKFIRRR